MYDDREGQFLRRFDVWSPMQCTQSNLDFWSVLFDPEQTGKLIDCRLLAKALCSESHGYIWCPCFADHGSSRLRKAFQYDRDINHAPESDERIGRVEVEMLKVLPWLHISMATSAKCKYNVSKSKRVAVYLQGLMKSDWVVVQGSVRWVPVGKVKEG